MDRGAGRDLLEVLSTVEALFKVALSSRSFARCRGIGNRFPVEVDAMDAWHAHEVVPAEGEGAAALELPYRQGSEGARPVVQVRS
ncbi:hypothetical protein H181DRAFT_03420 [Streptomyces sp. WMMB 714]|jgi:hypothetical protein|uniref:hypothetical protein n=1 Tax=Streptomyces sp. WMMB 714 TaxID=1286822 RepID=UPI0005F88E52|nr:hypothetical protein [Streptomyces sp. WMMB 714]SCK39789.1 hypothetical protein H181DRAFT_03420 [Streptomyces sp. WMMB 714]